MATIDRSADSSLRQHLVELLRGEHAHVGFAGAIRRVPPALRGARPDGVEHSLWELLEHLRLAQWDILEFSRNPAHVSPAWPAGYWPAGGAEPPDETAWDRSVAGFGADLEAMVSLVSDPAVDLFAPLAHGKGQTLLREAMLAADHNAYHVGQIVTVRQMLGDWPPAGT
jgi:DinB superfamily